MFVSLYQTNKTIMKINKFLVTVKYTPNTSFQHTFDSMRTAETFNKMMRAQKLKTSITIINNK